MSKKIPRLPAERNWFKVESMLFYRPAGAAAQQFPNPIGLCLQARRCEVESPFDSCGGGDIRAVGEREWVRAGSITAVFKTEAEVCLDLWPDLYPADLARIIARHKHQEAA